MIRIRGAATHCSDCDGLGAKLDEDMGSMQLVARVVQFHSVAPGRDGRSPGRLIEDKAQQAARPSSRCYGLENSGR